MRDKQQVCRGKRQEISICRQFLARQGLVLFCLFAGCCLIAGNLISLAVLKPAEISLNRASPLGFKAQRPDIVDADGVLLATDITAPSLYADPSGLMEPAQVVKKLKKALPELDEMDLLRQMSHEKRQFVFIKRGMHPAKAQEIFDLGLPGVDVTEEVRRVYPKGGLGGYLIGHVDIDNVGRSGIEKYIDEQTSRDLHTSPFEPVAPVVMSLNVGASHVLGEELSKAMKLYKAKAAAGLVLNVHTGEVVALASLPATDPQKPSLLLDRERFDRITGGAFELGSVFKIVTMAMVLESGVADLNTEVDVTGPYRLGAHRIQDYHPHKGPLSLRDIFVRSSNIGTARLASKVKISDHKAFLQKLRLMDPIKTEIGVMRAPSTAKRWGEVHAATVSYGHGITVAPLQFAASVAALVNGGIYLTPTFLKRDERSAKQQGERVVSTATSEAVRRLLRQNVIDLHGSGKRAEVAPFRVGGKTGTANKVVDGKYVKDKVLTSFVSIFPFDKPEYLVFVMLDEPKATPKTGDLTVAGVNAAPTTGRIISRLAPLFKVKPFFPVPYRLTAER